MTDILHRVELSAPRDRVYAALTDQKGLAAWWTPMVETTPEVGETARFRFGAGKHGPDMKITDRTPGERVGWTCTDGPWPGHTFDFDIRPHEKGAVLYFAHRGWPEASDFYMHCNCKWGYFLGVSLKKYVETGTGAPHPQDPNF